MVHEKMQYTHLHEITPVHWNFRSLCTWAACKSEESSALSVQRDHRLPGILEAFTKLWGSSAVWKAGWSLVGAVRKGLIGISLEARLLLQPTGSPVSFIFVLFVAIPPSSYHNPVLLPTAVVTPSSEPPYHLLVASCLWCVSCATSIFMYITPIISSSFWGQTPLFYTFW